MKVCSAKKSMCEVKREKYRRVVEQMQEKSSPLKIIFCFFCNAGLLYPVNMEIFDEWNSARFRRPVDRTRRGGENARATDGFAQREL